MTEPDSWKLVREAKRLFAAAKTPEDRARAISGWRSALRVVRKQHGISKALLQGFDELLAEAKKQHAANRRRRSTAHNGRSSIVRVQLRSLGSERAVLAAKLAASPNGKTPTVRVVIVNMGEPVPYEIPKATAAALYPFPEELWDRADEIQIALSVTGDPWAGLFAEGRKLAEGTFGFGGGG